MDLEIEFLQFREKYSRIIRDLAKGEKIMSGNKGLFIATVFFVVSAGFSLFATETNDVIIKIDRLVTLGEDADPSIGDEIANSIEKNPVEISKELSRRIRENKLTEQQLAAYVWAIGLTKDQKISNEIEGLYRKNKSDLVKANCLSALASIGGHQAGAFLLSILEGTKNTERRFDILNLLGQMQFEAALPQTDEILIKEPSEFSWQSIFVFGKMGDVAVPFLLEKINDRNLYKRGNAINVVGQWLIPPEASKPLLDHYWLENDTELRGMILSSMERVITDLTEMKMVFEQVVAKEKDDELVSFARETLGNLGRMNAEVVLDSKNKKVSASSFQSEYAELFRSAGKKGSFEILFVSSSAQDEPKLKSLRERILQRNSDEAFEDFQKVNSIITRNRLIYNPKERRD